MRAQLIWVVGLNTFEICAMNADGTYIEPDPPAMRSAGVGPSMIQRSDNVSLALETRQPRWIRGDQLRCFVPPVIRYLRNLRYLNGAPSSIPQRAVNWRALRAERTRTAGHRD
jgi:hypothetical protein